MFGVPPEGNMHICLKFHGNPSHSCRDVSVWTKMMLPCLWLKIHIFIFVNNFFLMSSQGISIKCLTRYPDIFFYFQKSCFFLLSTQGNINKMVGLFIVRMSLNTCKPTRPVFPLTFRGHQFATDAHPLFMR